MSSVPRAFFKRAVEESHWDLLDKLLERDSSALQDNSLYTDTWGEWWGLLVECAGRGQVDGVRVLLHRGADPGATTWGDGMPMSALEVARERGFDAIVRLLEGRDPAVYIRRTDPPFPEPAPGDGALERQAEVARATGLVFQVEAFEEIRPPSPDGEPGPASPGTAPR